MWRAITYVGSGFTLIAFLWAVAAWVYRHKLLERERLINSVPETERAALVERILVTFDINTSDLTKKQKYDLAINQIHERAKRYRVTATVVVIIAFFTATVTLVALTTKHSSDPIPTPTPTTVPLPTSTPIPTSSPLPQVLGTIRGCRLHYTDYFVDRPNIKTIYFQKGFVSVKSQKGDMLKAEIFGDGLFEIKVPAVQTGSDYDLSFDATGFISNHKTVRVFPDQVTPVPDDFCRVVEIPKASKRPPLPTPSLSFDPNLFPNVNSSNNTNSQKSSNLR